MSALWLMPRETVTPETIKLFVIGLPFLIADFGSASSAGANRRSVRSKIVLALFFISGAVLMI